MGTRIQDRSRPTKRPQARVSYTSVGGAPTYDYQASQTPRVDKRGYPTTSGVAVPVTTIGLVTYGLATPAPPTGRPMYAPIAQGGERLLIRQDYPL